MDIPVRREIPQPVLDAAIAWLVKLQSGTADAATRAACQAWREANAEHEYAWQQLQAIEQTFHNLPAVPPTLAFKTLEAALRQRGVRQSRRKALKLLGLGFVGIASGALIAEEIPWRRMTADYRTATGERRTVTLADGTELHLNTDTAVDVAYTDEQRRIVLSAGEIFIATGKDATATTGRPFFVQTAQGQLQALGTRFLVRQQQDATRLYVQEGAVAMHVSTVRTAVAQAGEAFLMNAHGQTRITDPAFDATGWLEGALVAKQMRLADFVAELSRYRSGWLRCDPIVADLRVSGVFQLNDTDRALTALTSALPVKIEYRTRYWVLVTGNS